MRRQSILGLVFSRSLVAHYGWNQAGFFVQLTRMENDTMIHGWYDQPNRRGTFDIIKTCGGTIFLLCWSSVYPNVPSLKSGVLGKFVHRLKMFLIAVLGPEFIFMTALGQLNAAWRGRKAWRQGGHLDWTLRHCFFANMGGVHLAFRDRNSAGSPSFPVDCEQLLYLVQHKHMPRPEISEEDINDRNRADELARAIAIVQALWFTINAVTRAATGLHVTTLELTTLSFVFQMTCSSLCWWYKPMDISRPITVFVNTDLAAVLHEARAPQTPLGQTPLSFLNRREGFLSRTWSLYVQILRAILRFAIRTAQSASSGQEDHFRSVEFPETELRWDMCFCWAVPAYSAIFLAAWDFSFPSLIERTLWRLAAVYCLIYAAVGCAIAFCFDNRSRIVSCYHILAGIQEPNASHNDHTRAARLRSQNAGMSRIDALTHRANQRAHDILGRFRNNDPLLALPIRVLLLTTGLCAVYCWARLYILLEDVIGLRSLPESAFQTVNWGQYSPIL